MPENDTTPLSDEETDALRCLSYFSAGALAYLGDAALETLVRLRLVRAGISDAGELNRRSLSYVRAGAQSAAVERILPHLSALEQTLYRRGRNAGSKSHPKGATAVEYRRATGLEALFGGLELLERDARMQELFALAFPETESS